ncbi:hypothetical protein EV198_3108 [Roseivirga ehrenbergii]|uniref:DoxX family protein n=1 Tax=Roseivirga ehrenbergii (strain DSM 102268 / JCM 13514 / KCTC 12282 / NCIMB 14502 / KMM 6017) TaxID=279360 RepID=A0A150XCA9_ROSEK|nr:hypothetical protein [Roseivirga ehrenbergii]KYG76369.1 hypothetical protein MB14_03740 [Roseivirga ehrenbergii]TCL00092.1 hypothetical protein EV198_3108 [Roseivirga ehrenbergii]
MKKRVNQSINIISILVLIYFAVPKILGLSQSVTGFEQFESVLHIDATFFRLFTGFSELIIAALILTHAFTKNRMVGLAAFLFLLATMVSALGIEFFVRPEPVMLLVVIAIILMLTSSYKLKNILNHE